MSLLRTNRVSKVQGMAENRVILGIFSGLFALAHAQAAVMPPPQGADEGHNWRVYVADQETYDSNLYRLPTNFGLLTGLGVPYASRSDDINSASLGGGGNWFIGRQVIGLNLQVDENRFARNSSLNNTSGTGHLNWNWLVGSRISGQVGVDYNRAIANFAETLYLGRDLIDTKDYFGSARYQLGPHWALYGDARKVDYSHSASAAQYNNFSDKVGTAGIEYANNVDDSFQLEYAYTNGYFPQNFIFNNQLVNRNFREDTGRFLVKYALTDKTAINAYAGYLKRDFVNVQLGSYAGDIWRVSADWRPTGKTDLVLSGWHELHSYSASEADYFVSHGASFAPAWIPSEKISLSLVFSFEDQNFIPSSSTVLVGGARTDKITAEQLNLLYTPRQSLFLNAFFRNEERNSTDQKFKFNDKQANVSVTFKFW